MKSLVIAAAALTWAGCYSPSPVAGGFRCEVDSGLLCPEGLRCDQGTGLCVKPAITMDMGLAALDFSLDSGTPALPSTCDDRVRAGSVSGLTNLTGANSAQDEIELALSSDGTRIYFLRAGGLYTAAIDAANPKSVGTAAAVTVTGAPDAYNGGSFAGGNYWFSGTTAGNTTTRLYSGTFSSPTVLTATATTVGPVTTTCPFLEPAFVDGDATGELYLSYPLAGCNFPGGKSSYVVQGTATKNLGAFYSALMVPGYRSPFVLPGGLTLLVVTSDSNHLYWAERPSTDVQWTGPHALPLDSLGDGSPDVEQAVVSTDCKTLYLVSRRPGGKGGTDLWAADISPN